MHRRPRTLLLAAFGCAIACAAVYVVGLRTQFGGRIDAALLDRFAALDGPRVHALAGDLVRFVDPGPYAVLGAALVVVAVALRRPRQAAVAGLVLAGAGLTSQVLKHMLPAPRPHPSPSASLITDAAWPSGHTTGLVALALCVVLVAPVRLRPLAAAAGGVAALLVPACLLVIGSHYPSDVLGGYLVAAGWFALGVAALELTAARRAPSAEALLAAGAGLTVAGSAAVLAVVFADPDRALSFVQHHTTFAVSTVALVAAAAALVSRALVARRAHRVA